MHGVDTDTVRGAEAGTTRRVAVITLCIVGLNSYSTKPTTDILDLHGLR